MSVEDSINGLAAALREIAAALREEVVVSNNLPATNAAPAKKSRRRPPLPELPEGLLEEAQEARVAALETEPKATLEAEGLPPAPPVMPNPAATATKESVAALVVHLVSKLQQRPKAVEILATFGAKNIHELDPIQYGPATAAFQEAIRRATPAG